MVAFSGDQLSLFHDSHKVFAEAPKKTENHPLPKEFSEPNIAYGTKVFFKINPEVMVEGRAILGMAQADVPVHCNPKGTVRIRYKHDGEMHECQMPVDRVGFGRDKAAEGNCQPCQLPFTIGDRVIPLPRKTCHGDTTTSFPGRVGIVVDVLPKIHRCKVYFGVQNHPSSESWEFLEKTDRVAHLWPRPLSQEPTPVCWVEWKRTSSGWMYTGTMGLNLRDRQPNTELFPDGIDPNVCGVAT